MVTQTRALTKLTASTWGATFAKARQVYCTVIRPAITYGSAVWHCPSAIKGAGKGNVDKLAVIQNKWLRVVAGAYKATPIEVLHAEAMVLPIKDHLDQLQAKTRTRLKINGQAAFIKKQCKKITPKLRKRGTAITIDTPGRQKSQWASSIVEEITDIPQPDQPPPWIEKGEAYLEQLSNFRGAQHQRKKLIEKHFADKWKATWEAYQRSHDQNPIAAQAASLSKKERLDLHADLDKAESSLAVQIRTEKIGFAQFLHRQRVPTVASPACDCGWGSQTAKHIIRYCNLRSRRRRMLEEAGTTDYRTLVATPKGLKAVTAWLMKLGLLSQLSLATEQLYQ